MRTHDLKEKVRQQVQRGDIEEMLRLAGTEEGQTVLRALLGQIGGDPAVAA